jgi:solute:Na+ symporter, SSS family
VMVWILVGKFGGVGQVVADVAEKYPQHVPPAKQPDFWLVASLVFMTSFGTWGMPQMVQKFYAMKSEKIIYKAAIATTIFALIIAGAAYFSGALTHLYFEPKTLPMLESAAKPSPNFDAFIPTMLTQLLPDWLMAVIILLILSASMSTLSSLVLVAAGALTIDLYKGHVNPAMSRERSLLMIRVFSGIFVAVSWIIAKFQLAFIVTLMSLTWGVVAGAFMAPFLYGLYWKRTTAPSVLVAMLSSVVINIVFAVALGLDSYGKYSPMIACLAMLVPFVTVPLVSWCTRPPEPALIEKAFAKGEEARAAMPVAVEAQ